MALVTALAGYDVGCDRTWEAPHDLKRVYRIPAFGSEGGAKKVGLT
jgi:hypothetical protein